MENSRNEKKIKIDLFYGPFFPPNSPLLLLYSHFVKPLELFCLNSSWQGAFGKCGISAI